MARKLARMWAFILTKQPVREWYIIMSPGIAQQQIFITIWMKQGSSSSRCATGVIKNWKQLGSIKYLANAAAPFPRSLTYRELHLYSTKNIYRSQIIRSGSITWFAAHTILFCRNGGGGLKYKFQLSTAKDAAL